MKMKKLLCLAVAIVMAIGMLSGCGNGDSGSNAEKFAETDEKLTLSWLGFPRLPGAAEGTTPELLLEEKFNVEIKPLFYEETKYEEKSAMLLAGGEIPDLIYEMDPVYVINHAYQDFLVELPYETIEKYAPEYFAYLTEYSPVTWIHSRYDGKNWGVPNINYSHMVSNVTFWRKDWLDKFGLEVPKTLDETYTALYKFANEDPDGNGKKDTYGFSTGQTKHSFFPSIFGAYGCLPFWWQEVDGEIVYGGVTDACKEALKLLASWYKDGLIHPEFYSKNTDMSTEQVGANLASDYQDPLDATHTINKLKETNPKAETAYGFLPTGPDGLSGTRRWGNSCNIVCFGNTEGYGVKVPRMLQMIEGMFTDHDLYRELRIGQEGVHWEQAAPDTKSRDSFVMLPGFGGGNASETRLAGFDKITSGPSMFTPVSTTYEDYLTYRSDSYKAFLNEWTDEKYCLTDYFDKPDVVPSSADYYADLSAKQMAIMIEIIQGVKPIEAYDEFIKLWETGGGKIMTEEANDLKKELGDIYKEIGVK